MADLKIKDSQGNVLYTVKNADKSGDKKVSEQELKDAGAANKTVDAAKLQKLGLDQATLEKLIAGTKVDGSSDTEVTLEQLLQNAGAFSLGSESEGALTAKVDEGVKKLEMLNDALGKMKAELAKMKSATPPPAATDPAVKSLEDAIKMAENQFKQVFEQLQEKSGDKDFPNYAKADLNKYAGASEGKYKAAKAPSAPTAGGTMTSGSAGATPVAPQAADSGKAAGAAQQAQPQFPSSGKAAGPGNPAGPFPYNDWYNANMAQDAKLSALDAVGKSQSEQKKMMMLFMYFAMMAMSGDIGAMASFMQFITTIVTKDKAMQNVNMAKKMIELQDASRAATDLLMKTVAYKEGDGAVSANFQKVMEQVKAEQGSIATSQKLISQMMEDFAQVSEFLNNMQKSLLDVKGRILAKSSQLV